MLEKFLAKHIYVVLIPRSRNDIYINERIWQVEEWLGKLEKQGTGEQLSEATNVTPLPSLAEFPEEGDKELDFQHEREKERE